MDPPGHKTLTGPAVSTRRAHQVFPEDHAAADGRMHGRDDPLNPPNDFRQNPMEDFLIGIYRCIICQSLYIYILLYDIFL